MTNSAEADNMMRKARIKIRDMRNRIERDEIGHMIPDAYNVMFMAAKAALLKRDIQVQSHRTVIATYRREFIDNHVITPEFDSYLTKIQGYWEREGTPDAEAVDAARAERIVEAAHKLVEALAETMKDPSKEPFRIR